MAEENKLLPCPFCGGEAHADYHEAPEGRSYWIAACWNPDCPTNPATGEWRTEETAIAAWNRRATPSSDAMKEALGDIARQKMAAELGDEWGGADFEYAYDKMIEVARAALSQQAERGTS